MADSVAPKKRGPKVDSDNAVNLDTYCHSDGLTYRQHRRCRGCLLLVGEKHLVQRLNKRRLCNRCEPQVPADGIRRDMDGVIIEVVRL